MKDSQTLISNLVNLPHLKKLHHLYQLEKIKIFLNKNTKDNLLFMTIKNNQILFAFKNPIICNEFNKYVSENLTHSLKQNQQFFPFLPENFTIKGYVPLNQLKRYTQTQTIITQNYDERSLGNFHNHCKDEKLHAKFESLRAIILQKNNKL